SHFGLGAHDDRRVPVDRQRTRSVARRPVELSEHVAVEEGAVDVGDRRVGRAVAARRDRPGPRRDRRNVAPWETTDSATSAGYRSTCTTTRTIATAPSLGRA